MKGYSFVFGYFVINLAIWTVGMIAPYLNLPLYREATMDPSNLLTLFSLDAFTVIAGAVGGTVVTILAFVTRSAALSTGVLLLWIIGIIFRPIQDIFIGLPYLLDTVMADIPIVGTIVSQVFVAIGALLLFIFLVEIIAGRQIT